MKVLLVEPNYYSKYPPLGLLKISTMHKQKGDVVDYVVGMDDSISGKYDRVYVTSLWTWGWEDVWECVRYYKRLSPEAEVWLGGLYASIIPHHAKKSGADYVHKGLYDEAENVLPDYDILPYNWNGSIMFSTRGCTSNCNFCIVPKLEGDLTVEKTSIKKYVHEDHSQIILFDNDFLSSPIRDEILEQLKEIEKRVDFNQGLKATQITGEVADKLSELRLGGRKKKPKIRLGYDTLSQSIPVQTAIENLKGAGIRGKEIMTYNLFNYDESPDKFLERLRNTLEWGAASYPMRYQPLDTLEKNSFIAPEWTKEELDMVEVARRVIGYGGTFPPYKGLVKKFTLADGFWDAFKEFSEKGGTPNIYEM